MKSLRSVSLIILMALIVYSFVSIQDSGLYFEESGEGETIIFVHGSQEDYRAFMPQLELLGKEFHVVTYSRRYNFPNKNSYEKGTDFSPMTEAEDLEKLRQQLGVDKFNLVGHSYGGLIGLAYAKKYQDRLASITITEPPVLSIDGCNESLAATEKGLIERLKASFATKDTTVVMKAIFEFFVGQDIQDQIPPVALNALKANLPEMEALANSENPFPNLNSNFEFPSFIITSEYEMPVLKCTNEALIRTTPDAKHMVIPKASHDMWMTHPEIMSGYIKEFLLEK